MKICANCGVEVVRKPSFWKRIKGLATCSKTCRAEYLKTVYLGSNNPNSHGQDTFDAFFRRKHNNLKHTASQRGIEYSLTPEILKQQYVIQNGLCWYTSIPLKFSSTNNWKIKNQADFDVLSVDRLDNDVGYLPGNIVMACTGINKAKGNCSEKEFQNFLNAILLLKNSPIKIKAKKIRPNASLPSKQSLGDAGYDIAASHIEETDTQVKIYTGISVEPPIGIYLELFPRSSVVKKGLSLANSVGIIDNSYRGEIIAIFNKLPNYKGISLGERIGQLVPRQYSVCMFEEVKELSDTFRGDGAFGSTGT